MRIQSVKNGRFACHFLLALGSALCLSASCAWARIKLITLPVRERVEIQLDNDSTTLVEEERIVPLLATVTGELNQVEFSWANVSIDPQSIIFRVVGAAEQNSDDLGAQIVSVSYPPGESALVWQIAAQKSGAVRVRISYNMYGMSKTFRYTALADHAEKNLLLRQYMCVKNQSGEEYLSALAANAGALLWVGWGKEFPRPIGLHETKDILLGKFSNIPICKTYACDAQTFGFLDAAQDKLNVRMYYAIRNAPSLDNGFGSTALPAGKVRIFIAPAEKDASTTFVGEDLIDYTAAGDEAKLFLGIAQDIVVKRLVATDKIEQRCRNLRDRRVSIRYEFENFKEEPVVVDLCENPLQICGLAREVNGNRTDGDNAKLPEWKILPETDLAKSPDLAETRLDRILYHVELPPRDKDGKPKKIIRHLHLMFYNEIF